MLSGAQRSAVAYVTVLLLLAHAPSVEATSARERPNIVFILADDLGWGDLGCYGSTFYETPSIDKLRQEGMRFLAGYTCAPNCAPTRAAFLSGQYSPRTGVYTVNTGARGQEEFRRLVAVKNKTELSPSVVTVAESLRAAGYRTGHFGKWHLGRTEATSPQSQGFEQSVGADRGRSTHFVPYRSKTLPDGPPDECLTDRLTDEAIAFISRVKDEPFFVFLSHYSVHTPIQPKPELARRFRKKEASGHQKNPDYAAMVNNLDANVGRVVDHIDRLGLSERTVIFFSSDNGGVGGYLRAGIPGGREITDNAPFRGGKGMLYEGGIRVPLIVRWRGTVAPNSECRQAVATVDFYPTFLALARAQPRGAVTLDGENFLPLLQRGDAAQWSRSDLFWHFPGYLQASSERGTWRTTPAGAMRSGDWKLIEFFETGKTELYHLSEDPGESMDRSETQRDKAQELHAKLLRWRKRVEAPMPRRKH